MRQYRITKYDISKRAADGTYLDQQEWTSLADVGKVLGGKILTPQEYLLVEQRYVSAALRFFAMSDLPHLRVTEFSNNQTAQILDEFKKDFPFLKKTELNELNFKEDQKVQADEIGFLVEQNLRGTVDCKLEFDDAFFIHFGWDFYMYVGCHKTSDAAYSETLADGMFVEDFMSPHGRPKNGEMSIKILVANREKNTSESIEKQAYFIDDEILMPHADWRQLRDIFGYSTEHPFFGCFDIDEQTAEKINAAYGMSLDPKRCCYSLETSDN